MRLDGMKSVALKSRSVEVIFVVSHSGVARHWSVIELVQLRPGGGSQERAALAANSVRRMTARLNLALIVRTLEQTSVKLRMTLDLDEIYELTHPLSPNDDLGWTRTAL